MLLKYLVSAAIACTAVPANAQDATSDILSAPNLSAVSYPENYQEPQQAPQQVHAPAAQAEDLVSKSDQQSQDLVSKSDQTTQAVPEVTAQAAPEAMPEAVVPVANPQKPRTLGDIILAAYTQSPTLRAQREALRQQYENVNQADSYKRPTISLDGGIAAQYLDTKPGGDDNLTTSDIGITGTQYLYRGGRTLAQVDQQLKLSKAAQAAYDSAVQTTMLNVLIAAMDIQRDRATIELEQKNLEVLSRQLSSAQKGFEVGELTRTDVAQAQARVSGGQADLVSARADYSNALARFKQYSGTDGDDIKINLSQSLLAVPATVEEASTIAETEHPDVRSAQEVANAAGSAIKLAEGGLLPTVSLNGTVSQAWDPSVLLDESKGASLGLRASMPLYEAGATRSQIRQAKYAQFERKNIVEDTKRTVQKLVVTAWNDYNAGHASIEAYKNQVSAAQLARDGVYKEREVGSRTVLDTLNADAELVDAQVGLVRAERNEVVASLNLLASVGALTPAKLGINEEVLSEGYIDKVRGQIFGTEAEPLQ